MTDPRHVPVLKAETLDILEPGPGKRILDGTFGFGGHTEAFLAAGAEVLALDLDETAHEACLAMAHSRLICRRASFRDLDKMAAEAGWGRLHGVLLDLGVSSLQLDDPGKGFTYRAGGPLDLRFDQRSGPSAADLSGTFPKPSSRICCGTSARSGPAAAWPAPWSGPGPRLR